LLNIQVPTKVPWLTIRVHFLEAIFPFRGVGGHPTEPEASI
jgi:hypothetical protein